MANNSFKVALGILLVTLVLGIWWIVQQPTRVAGWIISSVTLILILLVTNQTIAKLVFSGKKESYFESTFAELGKQIAVGVIPALIFIALKVFFQLSIGTPREIEAGLLAPFFEEPLFRMVVPSILSFIGLSLIPIIILSAVVFSSFHWVAYGATFSNIGAFIGAGIFGVMSIIIYQTFRYNGKKSIIPLIIFHMIINITQLMSTGFIVIA